MMAPRVTLVVVDSILRLFFLLSPLLLTLPVALFSLEELEALPSWFGPLL